MNKFNHCAYSVRYAEPLCWAWARSGPAEEHSQLRSGAAVDSRLLLLLLLHHPLAGRQNQYLGWLTPSVMCHHLRVPFVRQITLIDARRFLLPCPGTLNHSARARWSHSHTELKAGGTVCAPWGWERAKRWANVSQNALHSWDRSRRLGLVLGCSVRPEERVVGVRGLWGCRLSSRRLLWSFLFPLPSTHTHIMWPPTLLWKTHGNQIVQGPDPICCGRERGPTCGGPLHIRSREPLGRVPLSPRFTSYWHLFSLGHDVVKT